MDTKIPRRFSHEPRKPKSPLMRILGSPKTTLFLGLFAFGTIVFYKQAILSKDIGEPKKTVKDIIKEKPLFDEKKALGRAREGGMLLTFGTLDTGDLLVRQNEGHLEVAAVVRKGNEFRVIRPYSGEFPVMSWLRQGDGRFALYKLPPTPRPKLLRLLAKLQERALQKTPQPLVAPTSQPSSKPTKLDPDALRNLWIFQVYRQVKIKLPTHTLSLLQEKPALKKLLDRTLYNDLAAQ
ncbi:MAG: hypothetical protein H6728_08485 [Myxococcales bacterium]|nr:hypothetical protein [Myxococcales bacterium]MCB9643097.1 hypothetical protein [Myxococcales bacterium]